MSNAERIKSYSEIKPGDYIVHAHHGIGRYKKLETLEVAASIKIIFIFEYRGTTSYMFRPIKLTLFRNILLPGKRADLA